ncbi:hypothetical protein FQN57_006502 [Myotisia sp. PD_48]|nr:hypothetical protein FQN57_006502 [Myotisia sp. PD_48]
MAASDGLLTVTGRLATFDLAHPVQKSRSSSSKTPKALVWPHKRPSPAELAHAGFFYAPTTASPDNATCFLCGFSLDGWEEDDDPFIEHLRHSSGCGWAIMIDIAQQSSDPTTIEDPTSTRISDARRATFVSWPHEGKRGDEHYRRSSDCSFFEFARTTSKKSTKSIRTKRTNASKGSRLSTQSNATTLSEAPRMDGELDHNDMDQSMISQATTATNASKAPKKAPKAKGRGAKSKKAEPSEPMSQEPDYATMEDVTLSTDGNISRGKKRKSEAVSEADNLDQQHLEPPSKKRATSSRAKRTQRATNSTVDYTEPTDDELGLEADSKPKRGRKKGSISKKPPKTSGASKASLRAGIPKDEEIDAALEADLDRDTVDGEDVVVNNTGVHRSSSNASIAPIRQTTKRQRDSASTDNGLHETSQKAPRKKEKKEPKKKTVKATKSKEKDPPAVNDEGTAPQKKGRAPARTISDIHLDTDVLATEIQDEALFSESVVGDQASKSKPAATSKGRKPKKKKAETKLTVAEIPDTSEAVAATTEIDDSEEVMTRLSTGSNHIYSTTIDDKSPTHLKPLHPTTQISEAVRPRHPEQNVDSSTPVRRQSGPNTALQHDIHSSHTPQPHKDTPSPSPQSSDAENQPPSSRPSRLSGMTAFTNMTSTKVPLATSTPTRSPSNEVSRPGHLVTAQPWCAVDLEEIFEHDQDDKENVNLTETLKAAKECLASPEKKMTVEEWIFWNAKKAEGKLRNECERVVGIFEREGGRAMRVLDGLECTD